MSTDPTPGLWRVALVCSLSLSVLAACGGGGGGEPITMAPAPAPVPAPPPAEPTSTSITLQSDSGDWIGQGQSYGYDPTTALIDATVSPAGRLTLLVRGNQQWTADLVPPAGSSTFRTGRYEGLPTTGTASAPNGAFRWFGGGRGCASSVATVDIDHVAYAGGALASISFRFQRYCDGASAALRGEVKWTRADTRTMPAAPAALPADLWRPPAAQVPASGDYVILHSEAGDPVALGRSLRYTTADTSIFASSGPNGEVLVQVAGTERWLGLLQVPEALAGRLATGYYPALRRTPLHNPGRGGLNWSGEGRSCQALDGWLAIDRAVYQQNVLVALEARFEQRCQGSAGVLRGAVRWAEPARVPVPQPLSSPGSWSAGNALPSAGTALFMESGRSDYMGGRFTHTATPSSAVFTVREAGGLLSVEANGEQHWFGQVRPAADGGPLRPGTYTGLGRPLSDNRPGQEWSMGSSCTFDDSWLVIDEVQYRAGTLSQIALRFDGRCSGTGDVLRGQLRWSDADQRQPPGPQSIPETFWRAPVAAVPTSGTFVHVDADPWRSISAEQQTRYTQSDADVIVVADGAGLTVRLRGEEYWDGAFQPMAGQPRVLPGYYPGLRRLPFHDPAKGGMSWYGDTHGCSEHASSVVIDSIVYTGERIDALDMRFEQNCGEAVVAAVRGQVRWRRDDPTRPPGPVLPVPATLWRPAAGVTPASGNYVYTQSAEGDFLGAGQTQLLTQAVRLAPRDRGVDIEVGTLLDGWLGHLEPMSSLPRLEPGYYPRLKGYPSWYNPARGGISWGGMGRGCNESFGWFVVDTVSYDGTAMTALQARFEMYCDNSPGPLRGEIRWAR